MSDEPDVVEEDVDEEDVPTGPPPGYISRSDLPPEEDDVDLSEVPPVSAVPGGVVLPSGEILYSDEEAAGRGGREEAVDDETE